MARFPGSSSGHGGFQAGMNGSPMEDLTPLGSGILFDSAFGQAYMNNGTSFDVKSKKMSTAHGSQVIIQSNLKPTLNDLNPPMTSSQLQYSPTMSLKGGKGSNKVNIMASPVQIKLSEPPALRETKAVKTSKSKKNGAGGSGSNGKNEMVFVNYSVQDTIETQKKKKKQSKRDRMLRIFTGNNNSGNNDGRSASSPGSSSTIIASKTLTVQSAPASAAKRTYGSFLKCHRYNPSNAVVESEQMDEIVPRSEPIPNGQKPALTRSASSNVALVRNNGRCSLAQSAQKFVKSEQLEKMDLLKFNIAKSAGNGAQTASGHANALQNTKSQSNIELRMVPTLKLEPNGPSTSLSNIPGALMQIKPNASSHSGNCDEDDDGDDDFDHHYMEPYQDTERISSVPSLHQSDVSSDTLSTYFTDENDASVAFSKLFTRKRTNTGGSISSLLSLSATQPSIPALDRHQSSTSVTSSMRYSPIRSGSQNRTRSNTRTSNHRLSRDLTSLQTSMKISNTDSSELPGMESYLDTHNKGNKPTHRKKQESISDMARLHSAQGAVMNYACTNSITSISSSSSTPGTADSALMQFPKPRSVKENSEDADMLEDDGHLYFRPTIHEDEEYESAMNTSASSSHIGISSTSTISTRQTAPELADANSYPSFMESKNPLAKHQHHLPDINTNSEMVLHTKQMGTEYGNESFNNYMDFNFEDLAPSQLFNDNGNLLHQVFNSSNNDTSTITSGMNVSPITVTGGNTSQDEVTTLMPSSHQMHSSNLSFQSRIMNDIDRLAHGFNLSDLPNE